MKKPAPGCIGVCSSTVYHAVENFVGFAVFAVRPLGGSKVRALRGMLFWPRLLSAAAEQKYWALAA